MAELMSEEGKALSGADSNVEERSGLVDQNNAAAPLPEPMADSMAKEPSAAAKTSPVHREAVWQQGPPAPVHPYAPSYGPAPTQYQGYYNPIYNPTTTGAMSDPVWQSFVSSRMKAQDLNYRQHLEQYLTSMQQIPGNQHQLFPAEQGATPAHAQPGESSFRQNQFNHANPAPASNAMYGRTPGSMPPAQIGLMSRRNLIQTHVQEEAKATLLALQRAHISQLPPDHELSNKEKAYLDALTKLHQAAENVLKISADNEMGAVDDDIVNSTTDLINSLSISGRNQGGFDMKRNNNQVFNNEPRRHQAQRNKRYSKYPDSNRKMDGEQGVKPEQGMRGTEGAAQHDMGGIQQPLPEHLAACNRRLTTREELEPANARFFVIKSFSEDDVHKCMKYNVWASTQTGNKRLDTAFRENAGKGPVYLFFSVNRSQRFCGMAEMISEVDYNSVFAGWAENGKWRGQFKVRWIFVKDIPNRCFRHIRLPNNENKPVTNSRDTTEVPMRLGYEVMRIFNEYEQKTSVLDDFAYYDKLQGERELAAKAGMPPMQRHPAQQRVL